MTLRALIFDVDGTLAETEEAHRQAFNQVFRAQGLGWHWSVGDYRHLLRTTGGKERMAAYRDDKGAGPDDALIASLHRQKTAAYAEILAQGGLQARPGIARLIAEARAAGIRLAIATTTSPANVQALCRCLWQQDAEQLFEIIAAGDAVAAKKPAPDVYHLALHQLGLPADQALALEDSRNGLRAAVAAGLRVVVTPSVYTEAEDFSGAAALWSDLGAVSLKNLQALG